MAGAQTRARGRAAGDVPHRARHASPEGLCCDQCFSAAITAGLLDALGRPDILDQLRAVLAPGGGGPQVLSLPEAAAYLGVSSHALYRLVAKPKPEIPARKLGARWMFHRSALDDWLRGGAA